jgi:hypothetical protein
MRTIDGAHPEHVRPVHPATRRNMRANQGYQDVVSSCFMEGSALSPLDKEAVTGRYAPFVG